MVSSSKDGICPKCQSGFINKKELILSKRGGGGLSGFLFDAYICDECAYTELFIQR